METHVEKAKYFFRKYGALAPKVIDEICGYALTIPMHVYLNNVKKEAWKIINDNSHETNCKDELEYNSKTVITINIEKASNSYGAYSTNVDGIYGSGDTIGEVVQSALDGFETIKEFKPEERPFDIDIIDGLIFTIDKQML